MDLVVPTAALSYQSGRYGGWNQNDILPKGSEAVAALGKTFGLYLPVEIGGKVKEHLFTFKITQTEE
jgi:hypothetical protein